MSGLDPDRDRILEVAVILTDGALEQTDEGPDLVVHQPDELLASMDEWNQRHHGESGLIELVKASEFDEAAVEQRILSWLGERCTPGAVPLAGNSVHQDRAFLRRWMPRLHDFLHYRNVDVSTLKELLRRWEPSIVNGAPSKSGQHRALDDIRESIAELRHYRDKAFAFKAESEGK